MERWQEIRSRERCYSLTEGKREYQYTSEMAGKYALWCKQRKAEGKNLSFKEFFDQLSYYEQNEIRILKYEGGFTFRYESPKK
jgi:hypothetical protein